MSKPKSGHTGAAKKCGALIGLISVQHALDDNRIKPDSTRKRQT